MTTETALVLIVILANAPAAVALWRLWRQRRNK